MEHKKYDILLFDLDGTLTDSGEGIMRCAQYALSKMGVNVDDYHTLRAFVGPPLEDSFKDFYGFTPERAHEAVLAYRERYFTLGMHEQELYEGVMEFLDRLKHAGYTLCIATSKMQRQANWVVEHFGLSPYIDKVFARDDEGILHSKADVINDGLRQLGITDRSRVLMIGDRKFDINGASECDLTSVGVLWGYGDREEFMAAGADYICADFDALTSIITTNS